jgi:hypothetical protein
MFLSKMESHKGTESIVPQGTAHDTSLNTSRQRIVFLPDNRCSAVAGAGATGTVQLLVQVQQMQLFIFGE